MKTSHSRKPRRFFFLTSNGKWGGSEELWSSAAEVLASNGHPVSIKLGWSIADTPPSARLHRLRELGCSISGGGQPEWVLQLRNPLIRQMLYCVAMAVQALHLRWFVARIKPNDLVVISQGCNLDGMGLARRCQAKNLPYVLISQKATEMYWPADANIEKLRALYAHSLHGFFVSHHNWHLTEEQIGMPIPRASVVRNPFLVPWEHSPEWPDSSSGFHLACVGRLEVSEKGQDLLLRVLARPKWRERPLTITFYGSGPQRQSLENMAKLFGLTSIFFGGFVSDITAIWKKHHALILGSRCEGLPLVVIEAMLCGRIGIVTDIAGNREVIADEKTGFLAASPEEDAIDAALEKAWQRRDEWQTLGLAAATSIREQVPPSPAAALAESLINIADANEAGVPIDPATFPFPLPKPLSVRNGNA